MKILLITKLYPGYENQPRSEMTYALHYFVKDWIKEGHDVKVIRIWPVYPSLFYLNSNNKKFNDENFIFENVDINRVTIKKYPKIDYLKKDIKKVCYKTSKIINSWGKPDVILCHCFNPGLYIGKELKREFDIPLHLTLHNVDINNISNIPSRLKKFTKLIDSVDKLGFRSKKLYEKFQKLNIRNNEGHIILSGIDENILISDIQLNNKVNKPTKTIMIAAKMVENKNIDVLIEAFSKVTSNKDIQLKIVGEGPEKKKLKELARKLKIENQVNFLGFLSREQVLREMEKADIFAMVSSSETFGLVYLEAMAKGCITIGSKGEGIDGIIQNSKNGYLCEPRNVKELTLTIETALNLKSENKKQILFQSINSVKKLTQVVLSNSYIQKLKDNEDN